MTDTPNHGYNRPEEGTQDWGQLLNANFEALDADIELRDAGPPSSNNYDPVDGGKYLDTDTGVVYLADGSSWTETFSFGGGGGGGGGISSLTGGDGINPDSIGNGDTLSVALGEYMGIDNGAVTFGASAEWKGGGGNTAIGNNSIVGGGRDNTASGAGATVPGGLRGAAENDGSFVWNDDTRYHNIPNTSNDGLSSNTAVDGEPVTGASTFSVSATNGFRFITGGVSSPNVTYIDGSGTLVPGGNAVGSPSGAGLRLETDDGTRVLELGVPGTDIGNRETGGNVVAGHPNNTVNNNASGVVIGGGGATNGNENTANGDYATVGGGRNNTASNNATVGGGTDNTASSGVGAPTVGGGTNNTADGLDSTVAGGADNTASNLAATVAGGLNNTANGGATVGGGGDNTASAGGATVPGGSRGAAESTNSFVWNDGTEYHDIPNLNGGNGLSSDTAVSNASGEPTGPNTFSVSADDGVRFITGGVTNPKVTYIPSDSAGWTTTSTRTVKTNIDPVEPREALAGVESMEVATWEYESEDGAGTTHIGPMAEEFHDAFDVGSSDEHINSINADGVALAAIQGLSTELDETREELAEARDELAEKDKRIAELEADSEQKDERIADLEARLAAVEDQLGDGDSQ